MQRSCAAAIGSAASRVLAVSGEAFAQARYATDAAACEALCRAAEATLVLAPASSRFARVAAGVAHRLGGVIDTHITAIGGTDSIEATRWFYRQRVEAVLTRDKRPWFLLLDAGTLRTVCRSGGSRFRGTGRGRASANPHHGDRLPRAGAGCADDSAGCEAAICRRGRLDQETARRAGACGRGGATDSEFPARIGRFAGEQQIAGRSGRRRPAGASLSHAHEPGRTDRRDAAPRQGPVDLLPRRRTARGGMAIYRRAARYFARSQLRMDARQGRRCLHRGCVQGDGEAERAARQQANNEFAVLWSPTVVAKDAKRMGHGTCLLIEKSPC